MAEPGFCECGCGQRTKIAKYNRPECGWIKGQPIRFIHNHHARLRERKPEAERLLAKRLITPAGCWEWTGARTDGYGYISSVKYAAKGLSCHRLAYMLWVGPIPPDRELDHLCRNRACFNPAHLEPVTHRENQQRGLVNQNTTKTHCPKGHPYDAENTAYTSGGRRRHCRACMRDYKRRKRLAAVGG